eukprot:106804-Rhodomonas_salina.2
MVARSYLTSKLEDWALELTDAEMIAHPSLNYPEDAIKIPGDPAVTASAQANVECKRRKVQTKLHKLLIETCNESFYAEC